jgi:hypothetical protein
MPGGVVMARRESFWSSLPGILTAVGTLVAACAAFIPLFLNKSGNVSPPPHVQVAAVASIGNQKTGSTIHSTSAAGSGLDASNGNAPGGSATGASTPRGGPTPSRRPTTPATTPASGPAISGVVFSGNTAAPTVTVTGSGFGSTPPAGQPDNTTSCGNYTNNGDDFGSALWFQDTGNFAAGDGTPPSGTCIGIIVLTWSADKVTYQFGNAYNSFDHWYLSNGDQYLVTVNGMQSSGTVSFSS